jgi:hypothetical protein
MPSDYLARDILFDPPFQRESDWDDSWEDSDEQLDAEFALACAAQRAEHSPKDPFGGEDLGFADGPQNANSVDPVDPAQSVCPAPPWTLADGIERCDGCWLIRPVRRGSLRVTGVLADLYPDGRPGYYCQDCTESGCYPPQEGI